MGTVIVLLTVIILLCGCIGCQLARVKLWRDAYWDLRNATDGLIEQLNQENHAQFESECG